MGIVNEYVIAGIFCSKCFAIIDSLPLTKRVCNNCLDLKKLEGRKHEHTRN
jgi:hypothetical protein